MFGKIIDLFFDKKIVKENASVLTVITKTTEKRQVVSLVKAKKTCLSLYFSTSKGLYGNKNIETNSLNNRTKFLKFADSYR